MKHYLFALLIAVLLSGCGGNYYSVSVDSLIDKETIQSATLDKHLIVPKAQIDANDLQYKEVKTKVISSLKTAGISVSDDLDQVGRIIVLDYGIIDGKEKLNNTTTPVYGITHFGKNGIPVYGLVGFQNTPTSSTEYRRWLGLKCYIFTHNLDEPFGDIQWQISVVSDGSSSDFRTVLPYLIKGLEAYLLKDSQGKKEMSFEENN